MNDDLILLLAVVGIGGVALYAVAKKKNGSGNNSGFWNDVGGFLGGLGGSGNGGGSGGSGSGGGGFFDGGGDGGDGSFFA